MSATSDIAGTDLVDLALGRVVAHLDSTTELCVALRRAADELGSLAADGRFDGWQPETAAVSTLEHLGTRDRAGTALYVGTDPPGMRTEPHEHRTWSITVGLHGTERNTVFTRRSGRADYVCDEEHDIGRGDTLVLLDHHGHATEAVGPGSNCHLHVFGQSLASLPPFEERLISVGG